MSFSPGAIFKHYRIERLIGKGGMGEVYLAEETTLGRKVAIKVLKQDTTADPKFVERFRNEARMLGQLYHPNIVALHTFIEDGGSYYLVMQYAPGITLAELISRTGPIPEQRAMRIFSQISVALAFAHSEGIIHRDIKPSNIMIDPERADRVLVMDFGIARMMDSQHITRTGMQVGTPCYMSPEQVLGKKDIGPPSDIYSSGVVLYEMLAGSLPYDMQAESPYTIQDRILKEPLPDPRMCYEYISDSSINLVKALTHKDPEKRHMSSPAASNGMDAYQPASQPAPSVNIIKTEPYREPRMPEGMVLVEGGVFWMGSNDGNEDERPVHEVEVPSFYLGKHLINQSEWLAIMGYNYSFFAGDDLPVEQVTWYDAVEYCNKRSIKEGLMPCYRRNSSEVDYDLHANGYRLPTESEWEYAARGGRNRRGCQYSGSDDVNSVAWHGGNSGDHTNPVGTKSPNELGIFDMSGNVWEWCWDWYYKKYPAKGGNDIKGPGKGTYRVLRGGSWYCKPSDRCRVSFRDSSIPGIKFSNIGFRVAMSFKT